MRAWGWLLLTIYHSVKRTVVQLDAVFFVALL